MIASTVRSAALPGGPQGPQRRRPVRARVVGRGAGARSPSACAPRRPRLVASRSCPTRTADRTACSRRTTWTRRLWRRLGTSRLARTLCAAPTGAANMALYGKMPSVTYQDYPAARARSCSGASIRRRPASISSRTSARRRSAARRLIVIDPRTTPLARAADMHLAGAAGHRRRRRARDSSIPVRRTGWPTRHFWRHTPGRRSAARASRAVDLREGGRRSPASTPALLERAAELYAEQLAGAHPLRLGTRAEPERRQCRAWRCWRCPRSAASSAFAAAATR